MVSNRIPGPLGMKPTQLEMGVSIGPKIDPQVGFVGFDFPDQWSSIELPTSHEVSKSTVTSREWPIQQVLSAIDVFYHDQIHVENIRIALDYLNQRFLGLSLGSVVDLLRRIDFRIPVGTVRFDQVMSQELVLVQFLNQMGKTDNFFSIMSKEEIASMGGVLMTNFRCFRVVDSEAEVLLCELLPEPGKTKSTSILSRSIPSSATDQYLNSTIVVPNPVGKYVLPTLV